MKKVKLFSFALAALMLGACSSEDVIDNGGNQTVLPGEKGYISLGINLPTTPSTRATNTNNDQFADGTPEEYAVNDAALLIFEGTDEERATFTGGYDLVNLSGNSVGGNITSQYKVTTSITKPTQGDIYALVVVNRGKVLAEEDGTWTLNGTPLTSATTLASFNQVAQTISASDLASTDKGFFMTNAPLYSVPGGVLSQAPNGKLSTLTLINAENVYSTEAEANANPAASVYVERAVAKVTVKGTNGKLTTNNNIAYDCQGWTFDVTNNKTYLVRNMSDANNWWAYNVSSNYRFVGSAAVGPNLFRTYWGVDPNYTGFTSDDFTKKTGTAPKDKELTAMYTDENPVAGYCLENTFNVANQNQDQTTRVIVAAKLGDGSDFYIINNDKGTLYDLDAVIKAIKAEYLANPDVVKALKDPTTGLIPGNSIGEDDLEVAFDESKEETGGNLPVAEVTINKSSLFPNNQIPEVLTEEGNTDIITAVNAGKKVSYYKGGIAYYPVMIQHFGDDLTPWSDTDAQNGVSYPAPNAENNWLGRYGVLRNNWYEINVTGIRDIGYAEVPEVYNTPDDPVNSYISVEINVLSWAKRTQDVNL